MISKAMLSALFWIAAAYDGVLGIAFLLAPAPLFDLVGVPPPNHFGYVQFPAALLIIFALMFIAIARDPHANRSIITYGILLKVSYCGVAMGYWFTQDIPFIWKPFAILDLLFAILFVAAYRALDTKRGDSVRPTAAPAV
jgi:hypothetical protein